MSSKKTQHDGLDDLNEVLSSSEQFIEKYQKPIATVTVIVVVLAAIFYSVYNFYFEPRGKEAQAMMANAEYYFAQDSFKVALKGNGADIVGFEAIIDDYGFSDAANLASAYAGLCAYNLGEYDQALSYLKEFNADDKLVQPAIVAAIGDCYVNLDKYDESVSYFTKAADKAANDMLSPIFLKKAARVYEKLGDYKKASDMYQQIKDNYPKSMDAMDIDKYIERATANIK